MSKIQILPILVLAVIYGLEKLFPHFEGRQARLRHTVNNLSIAVMGGILNLLFLLTVTGWTAAWAAENKFGLLNQWELPLGVRLLAAIVLFDLWMYGWHVLNHRTWLWQLHRAHHNDTSMDCTTALRFHPLEIGLSQILNLAVIALLGLRLSEFLVYNLILQIVIFFHHSNVGLPERWDRRLRPFIVTPNMHRVHHSQERRENDSNFSSIFSCWDRAFRTFQKMQDTKSIILGLKRFRETQWQDLGGFLIIPFQKP